MTQPPAACPVAHASRRAARRSIAYIRARGTIHGRGRLITYRCPVCDAWHVGRLVHPARPLT